MICTAYSDYSWDEMAGQTEQLGPTADLEEAVRHGGSAATGQRADGKMAAAPAGAAESGRVGIAWCRSARGCLGRRTQTLQAEIVERQRAAEALRQSEERYQLLFSKNPLPMLGVDMPTRSHFWRSTKLPCANTVIPDGGISGDDASGDLRTPEELALLLAAAGQERTVRKRLRLVTRHRKKDGSMIDVEIMSRAIHFGGCAAQLVLANNITERKAAEDRIRRAGDAAGPGARRDLRARPRGPDPVLEQGAPSVFTGGRRTEAVGNTTREIFPAGLYGAMHAAEKAFSGKGGVGRRIAQAHAVGPGSGGG